MRELPHRNYYEGIIQLREANDKVVDFLFDQLERVRSKGVFMTRMEKIKTGFDFYISDKREMYTIVKKMQKEFGGEIKLAPQLYTMDHSSGKEVYRLNIFFKPSEYKKGDVVKKGKIVIQVTSSSKKISGIDLRTDRKILLDYETGLKKLGPVHKTFVTKVKPSLEVMDPETFQSVSVMNSKNVKHGEKIKVVKDDNEIWVL
ncbi:MAG: NMD3-related protein [Candidatus Woesearchaeota archaeon]